MMPRYTSFLMGRTLTQPILDALNLSATTRQLVINQAITTAAYMDSVYHVHHLDIDDLARERLHRAFQAPSYRMNAIEIA